MNQLELKEARAKLIHDARQVIDKADNEKRTLHADEQESVDVMFAEADKIEDKIQTEAKREQLEQAESRMKEVKPSRRSYPTLTNSHEQPDYTRALRTWINPKRFKAEDVDNATRCGIDLSSQEIEILPPSFKQRSMTDAGAGLGLETVAWTEFFNGFYEYLKYYGPCLNVVTMHDSAAGVTLPIPVLDDTANTAEILGEEAEINPADVVTANVNLKAFKYSSKEVILSLELLQDSQVNLEQYIGRALATRFARKWNDDITNGDGSGKPYGLCNRAHNSGVVLDGTAAAPSFATNGADLLFNLADSLDDAYRFMPGVAYMMHRTTLSKIRKLKDDNHRYIFDPNFSGVTLGNPGTINGYPVIVNPNMPVSGANKPVILFGDYSQYMWRRVSGIQFFRLDQLRIRTGQISFLAFARADGNLINVNAVQKALAPAS